MAGWQQFSAPLIYNEGENEEALLSRFVELQAKYPNRTCFEIADHVFKEAGLVDAEMRASQAGMAWQKDIGVLERIDSARRNGGEEPAKPLDKPTWQAELLAIARDLDMPAQGKKAAIDAYVAYGKSNGWIVEAQKVEKTDKTRRFPTIVFEQPNAA